MDYDTLRGFADTWGLVFLVVVFVAIIIFTFRPGSRKRARDAAEIPLREDQDNGRKEGN